MTHPTKTAALEKRQLERQLRNAGLSKRRAMKQISRTSKNQLLGAAGNPIKSPALSFKRQLKS